MTSYECKSNPSSKTVRTDYNNVLTTEADKQPSFHCALMPTGSCPTTLTLMYKLWGDASSKTPAQKANLDGLTVQQTVGALLYAL